MDLRPYQQQAIDAIWSAIREGVNNPLAVLPTGAGKSPVVGRLCVDAVHRWKGKALVLVHTKELIQQLESTIKRMWPTPYPPVGIMSAGLGKVEVEDVTVAGIQTAFRRGLMIGRRDIVIIDECQMLPPDGDGMYRTLINDLRTVNPKCKIIGLTATPYRTTTGRIDGEDGLFDQTVIDVPIPDLIEQGYLSPITGKNGGNPDLSEVHKRGGEFIQQELESAMADSAKVAAACDEIARYYPGRRGCLVFCCGTQHCQMVASALQERNIECMVVTADTPDIERNKAIELFKAGTLKCLVNTNILSIGFDAPHVDLIVMLRPTESPGLYYQQAGRGFRTCEGKDSCTILDMAGNMERHGPITTLNQRVSDNAERKGKGTGEAPAKTCENCREIVHCAVMICPSCGHKFPEKEIAKHGTMAADGDPLHGMAEWHEVGDCQYSPWPGKNGKPDTLRVDYYEANMLHKRITSEWVCVQHPHGSYAHTKAMQWLMQRLNYPIANSMIIVDDEEIPLTPENVSDSDICRYIKVPKRIKTKPDGKYIRIIDHDFTEELTDEDLPF